MAMNMIMITQLMAMKLRYRHDMLYREDPGHDGVGGYHNELQAMMQMMETELVARAATTCWPDDDEYDYDDDNDDDDDNDGYDDDDGDDGNDGYDDDDGDDGGQVDCKGGHHLLAR